MKTLAVLAICTAISREYSHMISGRDEGSFILHKIHKEHPFRNDFLKKKRKRK